MTIIIFFILFILGLIFKANKLVSGSIIFFIWIMSWTNQIADYSNYENHYLAASADYRDYGYYFLSVFFKNLGFDYFSFKLFFMGLGLIVLYKFLTTFSYNHSFVAALYMGFYCFFDIVQYRNFIAFTFVLLGLLILLKRRNDPFSKLMFILFLLLGSQIHASVLLFFIFLFADKSIFSTLNDFLLKFFFPVFLACMVSFFYLGNVSSRVDVYSSAISFVTKFVLALMYLMNIFFVLIYDKKEQNVMLPNSDVMYYSYNPNRFILLSNILFLVSLPLCFQNTLYLRLFKYMSLLNIVFISNKLVNVKSDLFITLQNIGLFVYALGILIMFYFMHASFEKFVLEPILFNNLLLN